MREARLPKFMEKKLNPEIDTTRFVNIRTEKFVFHVSNQPREIEAGETKVMPVYVAQLGAKHLVDLILQKDHNIKDSLRDTPLRRSLFVQILPDMGEMAEMKPLSKEDELAEIKKQLASQAETIKGLTAKKDDAEDKRVAELEKQIAELRAAMVAKPKKEKVAKK